MTQIKLNGLRSLMKKFESSSGKKTIKGKHWMIDVGASKAYWQLSYNYMPVMYCLNTTLKNYDLKRDDFFKVVDVVKQETTPTVA